MNRLCLVWSGHILGLCSCPATSQHDMMLTWQGNSHREPPMDENEAAQQTRLQTVSVLLVNYWAVLRIMCQAAFRGTEECWQVCRAICFDLL